MKGVCYVAGADLPKDWLDRAADLITPLAGTGIELVRTPTSLTLAQGTENLHLSVFGDSVTAVVQDGPAAPVFVAILVAIKRKVGGIDLVDDRQRDISNRVTQSDPLFGRNWDAVYAVASAMGLMAHRDAIAAYRKLNSRLI